MTFPVVESEASSSQGTNTTTHTVTMPSGVASGDLLVAAIEFDARPVRSGQIIDDWAEILNTSDSGDGVSLYAYWKRATGSEGSSQSITTDVAQCSSHKTWRITGDNTGTSPTSAVFQGSSPGTSADPPSLNPAGWDVEDTLWLALVASDDGSITVTGFPSSYTDTGQVNADGSTDGVTLGWARRENAAASENPGAFTLSSATPFCTATIAIRPALPVSHLATGTKSAGGTTTVAPSYPAGVADDVLAIACRSAWNEAVTTSSETGWTDHTDLLGGLVAAAANDSHQTRVAVDLRQLDGTETGSVTFDQGGTANGALGLIMLYSKSPSSATWSTAIVTGDDATHGANRSVTASGSVSLAPADVVVAVAAVDTDTSLASFSAPAITASGITFGTTTRRTSGAGVGTGNDGNIEIFDATVTSGTGTAAPVLAFTTTTSQCGPVAFVRLRSVTSGDATATPAVTAATVALPRSLDDVTAGPAAVAQTVSLPQSSPLAVTLSQPAALASTVALPGATASGTASATPAVLTASAALPAATPSAAVTVTPAVLAAVTALPVPGVAVAASPAVAVVVVALPQADAIAGGSATTTPDAIVAAAALARPANNITTGPAVVAATTGLDRPAVASQASPAAVTLVAALPQSAVGVTAGPGVVGVSIGLPQAVPDVAGNATVTPAVTAVTATLASVGLNTAAGPATTAATTAAGAVTVAISATATPQGLAAPVALPAVTVDAASNVTVSAAVVAVGVAVPATGLSIGAGPAVVASTTAVGPVAVSVAVSPPVLAATAALPAAQVGGDTDATVHPAFIALMVLLPVAVAVGTTGPPQSAIYTETSPATFTETDTPTFREPPVATFRESA